jgi:hypothetical protein
MNSGAMGYQFISMLKKQASKEKLTSEPGSSSTKLGEVR